jgi:hypothetical protein
MMPTPLEALLVYAVVILCALYCVWAFLPAALKRRMARALLALSPRLGTSRRLQKLSQDSAGCGSGCDNCGSSPAQAVQEHKVQLFRRR